MYSLNLNIKSEIDTIVTAFINSGMKSFQDLLSEFQSLLEGCYDSSARKLLFASAQH